MSWSTYLKMSKVNLEMISPMKNNWKGRKKKKI